MSTKKGAALDIGPTVMKVVHGLLLKHGIAERLQSVVATAKPFRVLGLDINTNTTGYVVLNERGRLADAGHVSTKHLSSESQILDIGVDIASTLQRLHSTSETLPWVVGIEDFLKTYAGGRFHTKGLFQLAQLNGLVSYSCYTTFGARPQHVHPTTARALFRLAKPKDTNKQRKDAIKHIVLDFALAMEPALVRPEAPASFKYDVADAYVIALFTYWRHIADLALAADAAWTQSVTAATNLALAKPLARKAAAAPELDLQAHVASLLRAHVEQHIKDTLPPRAFAPSTY
ncbi:hypothetical protein SPRG_13074 [Saprolegnia parasitica CBS 223.65]|uniref:Mitochondrial resolvase Ydc2 catalytic domain-containing protein n=1 Tax=Saprolegnia parasitica (strain CBS 223.65) TaxID=695850 RepID=A0A067BN79_SAPPC|nr:hypothetical protein SPRG_13074 [Saprolegnia parasitica CBS 223.65]KDO19969.1 hypothetical protein SPRG_13074 [Saprolegnia parasitica CBS 223.65]|eukprot:XP_012209339.1 hypothetical protein SPRG_13074 [Saprolegnia parasitica CBS 223.65]